jgi:carboxy-cis,cis-muconate cyclase
MEPVCRNGRATLLKVLRRSFIMRLIRCCTLVSITPSKNFKLFSQLLVAEASRSDTNTRAIFVLAAKQAPFNVYGNPFYDHAGFGNVFSVNSEGGLEKNIQNYEYSPETGIHGMVFDPTETYLYSADLRGNSIWTHKKDSETGHLTLVNRLKAPAPGDHPRWVAIHPSGAYLYVLMEAGNRLGVYVIDEQSHIPTFTHITYPLIPPGMSVLLHIGYC